MKAVCFGELMLRLEPTLYTRFIQAKSFDATFGGGEAERIRIACEFRR